MADLWARSQDKLILTKVRNLRIEKSGEYYAIFDDINRYYLGCYETKERAINVLEGIQELLNHPGALNVINIVFDFPKE